VAFAIISVLGILAGSKRAGMVWYVAEPFPSFGSPNEAATAMVLIIALLLVRQTLRHQVTNLVGIGLALVMIVLTASRGGLMALLAFGVLTLPRLRWTWIVGGMILVAMVLPFVPQSYWVRLGRTAVQQRGTFETFTTMIRVLSWKTAWTVFLHHPILGVGYLGFGSMSSAYNPFRIVLGPAENYFLEIAAGMGIVGLIALGFVITRLLQLGRAVERVATPGSLGHSLARFHVPLILSLLVPCLSADNLVGMVGIGQIAMWCAMLVCAGHSGVRHRPT
jgi:O-antigen ligase